MEHWFAQQVATLAELIHKDCFLESLDRCCENDDFIPAFYRRFLGTSEEIREKFKDTDFEKQNVMLVRSLRLAADATIGKPESLQEIRDRAETHDRHHLDIKPHLYDQWLNSVVKTAQEFDPQWNDAVDESWNAILGHVINHMKKFY